MAVIGRTNAEIARWARAHGHVVEVESGPLDPRARAWCSCGYRSTWRLGGQRQAVEAAAHHLWTVWRAGRAHGA